MKKLSARFAPILVVMAIMAACSPAIPLQEERVVEQASDVATEAEVTRHFDLSEYRLQPQSAFYSVENSIPDVFQADAQPVNGGVSSRGFRVQLISTQDISVAEELRSEFIVWLDTEFPEMDIPAYLLFRQPFYRLHVGNFISRTDALEFSRILKRRFPDAWVVFDDINRDQITVFQTN